MNLLYLIIPYYSFISLYVLLYIRKFLNIIDRCFPNEHPLHKIFNKHTLKLSYSCMPNMKSIISSHNKAVLSDYHQSQTETNNKKCSLRNADVFPVVASLPPKNNDVIFRRERSDDRKYVCASQATKNATVERKINARSTENASYKMEFTKPQSQHKHHQNHT